MLVSRTYIFVSLVFFLGILHSGDIAKRAEYARLAKILCYGKREGVVRNRTSSPNRVDREATKHLFTSYAHSRFYERVIPP